MCVNTGYLCTCLTDDHPCEPCSMTAKERETEEDCLSNGSGKPCEEAARDGACEPEEAATHAVAPKDRTHNWGWLLSGTIFLNLLLLGVALVSASTFNSAAVDSADLQVFLIILILLTTLWMLYYQVYTARSEHAVLFKDGHAGPVWLRAGLVLFGLLSLIMDIFKIANYSGYLHCDSAVKVAFPVIQAVFLFVQTYFMWFHAKDCVQLQRNLTRCGLMLTLATNLILWMTAVTEESVHQTDIPDITNGTKLSLRRTYISRASYGEDKCKCSYSSCGIFKEAYYYLYPFNIEYSLFASAMAYVMWRNVGRVADEPHAHHKVQFHPREVLVGPVLGLLLVVAGLATFIVKDRAMMMHFVVNLVIVTLMSASAAAGCFMYRLERRDLLSEKNPTRSLDVGLLVAASVGQFVISYFTVVALVATGVQGYLNGLNLAWALVTILQLGLQNLFIIEGLHREPHHEPLPVTLFTNPYVVHGGGEASESGGAEDSELGGPEEEAKRTPEMGGDHSLTEQGHTPEHRHKLTWKRRVLKEVSVFLLLGNIILWIMPAFGARPQFDHGAETKFYQFTMWSAVVNIGLPFGIFYRMHSVASLFEVFFMS
ncbi:hypothetical protein NHX12_032430 [Muraenolepis orangiensis]|uniref:Otopetrin 2 n=1 Tax=Muraenolepis orangiensis TaxID=630683 RepID=A0A9Q0E5N9_9TELE|nr:hypothetical protein NHX12_032430 [Muraenolepis orangiensis]